jgi:phage terminase small subunit
MPELENPRHEAFAQNYVLSGNGSASYIAAGYKVSPEVAEVNSSRLLSNAKVLNRIRELQGERSLHFLQLAERVVTELEQIAFISPLDALEYVIPEGAELGEYRLKSPEQMDAATKAAISEIKFSRLGITVRFHPKADALSKLARICGLMGDFNEAVATLRRYGIHLHSEDGQWRVIDQQLPAIEAIASPVLEDDEE